LRGTSHVLRLSPDIAGTPSMHGKLRACESALET
jgi:hypothetical protein